MTVSDRGRELLSAIVTREALLPTILQEPRSNPGFLATILGLRMIVLLGLVLRFGVNKADYATSPELFGLIRLTLLFVFFYTLALGILWATAKSHFYSRTSKWAQLLLDIVVVSVLYFLTKDGESDLFIFYLLPLFIAAEYFSPAANLLVLLLLTASFMSVLSAIVGAFAVDSTGWFLKVFLPREFFFSAVVWAYLNHRRLPMPAALELDKERQAILLQIEKTANVREVASLKQQIDGYASNMERVTESLAAELQQKNELLNNQLKTIFDVSMATAEQDEEHAITRIVETLGESLGCQAGILQLLSKNDAGRDCLVLKACSGYARRYRHEVEFLDMDADSIVVDSFKSGHLRARRDIQFKKSNRHGAEIHHIRMIGECNLHAMICVPVRFHDRVRGILSYYRDSMRFFTPDEQRLAQAIAGYLGLTIENFDLYRETLAQSTERKNRLDTLYELGSQLTGFADVATLLRAVADKTRTRLAAEVSAVFLLENNRLVRKMMSGIENEWFREESYARGDGITGKALISLEGDDHGSIIVENNVDESKDVISTHLKRYQSKLKSGQVRHLIAVPLTGKAGPFGVLRVVNRLDQDGRLSAAGFSRADVDLLYTIGCVVGIAIENAKLLTETRRRLDEISRLQKASQILASALNMKDVLARIRATAKLVSNAAFISVVTVREDGSLPESAEDFGGVAPLHLRARPNGATRQIITTGEPVVIDEVLENGSHNPVILATQIKSYTGLPLKISNRVLGVVFFHSVYPRAFQDEMPILTAFAYQAAIALENARLYTEEQRKVNEAEALRTIGQVVSFTMDSNYAPILQTVVQEVARVLEVEQAGVVLFDRSRKIGRVAAEYQSVPDNTGSQVVIPLNGNQSIDRILETKAPVSIFDAENDPLTAAIRDVIKMRRIKSILIAPLIVNGEVIGTLGVDSIHQQRQFTPEDVQLCQLIATQAASAIENARLFEQAVEQKNRLRDYLSEMGKKLIQHTDLEGLYAFMVHSGARLLSAEDCSLYMLNKRGDFISYVAASHLPARLLGTTKMPVSSKPKCGLTAYVAATGETLVFLGDEFKHHPAWNGEFVEHLRYFASGACQSLLLVPVLSKTGQVIGVLKAENKLGPAASEGFSNFDAELLTLLGSQGGEDIERFRLYSLVGEEAARKERGRLQGELHDMLNVFHAGVMLEAEAASYWLANGDYERARAGLSQLWRVSRFTYGELNNILQDMRDPILESQGLVPALMNYVDAVGHDLVEFRSNLDVRLDPEVSHTLYRIAQGAVSNAIEHAGLSNAENGKMWIDLLQVEDTIILRVVDNGGGFDLKGLQLGYPRAFGLERMSQLARSLGASLQIDSQVGKGTSISVAVKMRRKDHVERSDQSADSR